VVDQGMKSSYDDAKQSVDSYDSQARDQRSLISSTESSVAACQITLRDQCRNFEKLAFLGGDGTGKKFSSHLDSIVRLLQLRYADMESSGEGVKEMRVIKASIDSLKKQHGVLVDACRQ